MTSISAREVDVKAAQEDKDAHVESTASSALEEALAQGSFEPEEAKTSPYVGNLIRGAEARMAATPTLASRAASSHPVEVAQPAPYSEDKEEEKTEIIPGPMFPASQRMSLIYSDIKSQLTQEQDARETAREFHERHVNSLTAYANTKIAREEQIIRELEKQIMQSQERINSIQVSLSAELENITAEFNRNDAAHDTIIDSLKQAASAFSEGHPVETDPDEQSDGEAKPAKPRRGQPK